MEALINTYEATFCHNTESHTHTHTHIYIYIYTHTHTHINSPEALISHCVSSMTKSHADMHGSSPAPSVGQ